MRTIINDRPPRGSVAQPPQFGPFMRYGPSPLAIYLALAEQYEADLARIGLCQTEHTEPGASHTDDCREKEWHTRNILERESPPTQMKRDAKTVVKIEAPTTSSTAACSTDTGAGDRHPKDTPLTKRFALRARPTESDLIYDEERQLFPEQIKYEPTFYGPPNKSNNTVAPHPSAN